MMTVGLQFYLGQLRHIDGGMVASVFWRLGNHELEGAGGTQGPGRDGLGRWGFTLAGTLPALHGWFAF